MNPQPVNPEEWEAPACAADRKPQVPLPSEAVLRGQSAVEIEHNDQIYRLQTTRQGKLILTK